MTEKLSINQKLDKLLANQEAMLKYEKKILAKEEVIEDLEEQELREEAQEEEALRELEKLQQQIQESLSKPITKISKKDVFKGLVGAFVGVMGHFAFVKGADLATTIGAGRATVLYIVALAILVSMLYFTGFRTVEKNLTFKLLPLRVMVLYAVAIAAIIIINLIFGFVEFPVQPLELYTLVGTSIILAVLGAGTADLIGRE